MEKIIEKNDLATCLKILTLTEMFRRLPVALVHVKAGNAP